MLSSDCSEGLVLFIYQYAHFGPGRAARIVCIIDSANAKPREGHPRACLMNERQNLRIRFSEISGDGPERKSLFLLLHDFAEELLFGGGQFD